MKQGLGAVWVPVLILAAFVVLVFLGMWHGWRKRGRKHDLPPLVPLAHAGNVDESTLLLPPAAARYFGTTVAWDWLDRVVARGLGARSSAQLRLDPEGLDIVRDGTGFRIPAGALRGARHDQGIAGKVVPPHGLLVVTWRHGDHELDSGFRLTDTSVENLHEKWIQAIEEIVKENAT